MVAAVRPENTAFSYQLRGRRAPGRGRRLMHAFVITPQTAHGPTTRSIRCCDLRRARGARQPLHLVPRGDAGPPRPGPRQPLLAAARERARTLGCPAVSLICFDQNSGARSLYEREGFTAVDRRAVVPHPIIHATGDALLMTSPVPRPSGKRTFKWSERCGTAIEEGCPRRIALVGMLLVSATAPRTTPPDPAGDWRATAAAIEPLYDNLGDLSHPVTTATEWPRILRPGAG